MRDPHWNPWKRDEPLSSEVPRSRRRVGNSGSVCFRSTTDEVGVVRVDMFMVDSAFAKHERSLLDCSFVHIKTFWAMSQISNCMSVAKFETELRPSATAVVCLALGVIEPLQVPPNYGLESIESPHLRCISPASPTPSKCCHGISN